MGGGGITGIHSPLHRAIDCVFHTLNQKDKSPIQDKEKDPCIDFQEGGVRNGKGGIKNNGSLQNWIKKIFRPPIHEIKGYVRDTYQYKDEEEALTAALPYTAHGEITAFSNSGNEKEDQRDKYSKQEVMKKLYMLRHINRKEMVGFEKEVYGHGYRCIGNEPMSHMISYGIEGNESKQVVYQRGHQKE